MADPATAAKAAKSGDGHDSGADGAAKAKASGAEKTVNQDGTYTLKGKFKDGGTWEKTFINADGSTHSVGKPDANYISKVKSHLSKGLNGDDLGQDSNNDGQYKGKSLELGKGGRAELLRDRIVMELVGKGYTHEQADSIASKQIKANAIKKYGADQVNSWSAKKGASAETKTAQS